jgi:hypothetical protein
MRITYNPNGFGSIMRAILFLSQEDISKKEWGVMHQHVVQLRKNIERVYHAQAKTESMKELPAIARAVLRQVEENTPLAELVTLSDDDLMKLAE